MAWLIAIIIKLSCGVCSYHVVCQFRFLRRLIYKSVLSVEPMEQRLHVAAVVYPTSIDPVLSGASRNSLSGILVSPPCMLYGRFVGRHPAAWFLILCTSRLLRTVEDSISAVTCLHPLSYASESTANYNYIYHLKGRHRKTHFASSAASVFHNFISEWVTKISSSGSPQHVNTAFTQTALL